MMNEFMALRQMESSNDLTNKQAALLEEKARTEKVIRALRLGDLDIQEITEMLKEGELNYQTEFQEKQLEEADKRIAESDSRMTLQQAQSDTQAAQALNMSVGALKTWQDAIWAQLKNDVYKESKINIDRDDIYTRALEPLITWLVQFLQPETGGGKGSDKGPEKNEDGTYKNVTDKLKDTYYSNDWIRNIWNSFKDFLKEQEKLKRNPDGTYNPAGTNWNK